MNALMMREMMPAIKKPMSHFMMFSSAFTIFSSESSSVFKDLNPESSSVLKDFKSDSMRVKWFSWSAMALAAALAFSSDAPASLRASYSSAIMVVIYTV